MTSRREAARTSSTCAWAASRVLRADASAASRTRSASSRAASRTTRAAPCAASHSSCADASAAARRQPTSSSAAIEDQLRAVAQRLVRLRRQLGDHLTQPFGVGGQLLGENGEARGAFPRRVTRLGQLRHIAVDLRGTVATAPSAGGEAMT